MATSHEMLVVSGPNGSGKTTLAEMYAAELGYLYLGADKIAAELSPDDPESQSIVASRQFSSELSAVVARKQSVVIESTLSGRTFLRTMERAKEEAFSILLIHLFLDSAETCVARVAERVQKGGHHVPELDIRRRFTRSAANFWYLYRPLCDRWLLMYNATSESLPIAEGDSLTHTVQDSELYSSFMKIVQANG